MNVPTWKTWLYSVLIAAWSFFAPVHVMIVCVFAITMVDLILGVGAAMKLHQPITSNQMRRTLSKLIAYQGAIIIAHLIGHGILNDIFQLTTMVASVIALAEAKSCFENLSIITGQQIFGGVLVKLNALAGSDRGPQGNVGEQGEPGERGPRGKRGKHGKDSSTADKLLARIAALEKALEKNHPHKKD